MAYSEQYVKSVIRSIPDWPEPGIMFRDITPIFQDPRASRMVANAFIDRYMTMDVSHIACIDARGFLFGAIIAHQLNKPLVLVRKKGKLPGDTIHQDYTLEYGTASVEIQQNVVSAGDKVVLIDDLIATGGTALAACTLLNGLGAKVVEVAALIDLPDLAGSTKIQDAGVSVFCLLAYEGV